MTQIESKYDQNQFSPDIVELQNTVNDNPDDLINKLSLAIALEQEKHYQEAYNVYQDIIKNDEEQVLSQTATQAVESLRKRNLVVTPEEAEIVAPQTIESEQLSQPEQLEREKRTDLLYKLASLPIGSKQFIALLVSSLISIIGVVLAGRFITTTLGQTQLERQAVTELEVSFNNYQSRINQTESGFRGQADNIAIIQAAKTYRTTGELPPDLANTLRRILVNEVSSRQIEYATLIGLDSKVVGSANSDRFGIIFNPNELLAEALKNPRRFQTNAIVSAEEIATEQPPFYERIENQDVLMNFTFTPVVDPTSDTMVGILVGGEIVDGKTLFLRKTIDTIGGGYGAIYAYKNGEFELVTSALQEVGSEELQTTVPLPDLSILEQARRGVGGDLVEQMEINNQDYVVAVKALPNYQGEEIAFIVRGTPEAELEALLNQSLIYQILVGLATLLVAILLALLLGKALTRPILKLQQTAKKIGAGELNVRANVTSNDEVGQLAQTLNEMAEQIEIYNTEIEQLAQQQQAEAQLQKRQREELQQNVINLLLEIEGASRGDLTVKAGVVAGEVGSIADAFNTTIRGLRKLVQQVIDSATLVQQTALSNGQLVNNLAQNSNKQDQSIQTVGASIEEIAQSSENISESAQNASSIARESRLTAQEGEKLIDDTVDNIYQIRHTVADTAKKAKRLADSSQEISKIVSIISNISEKTNLLAFNASIEAARAGENGQGFRVVADEVRRLAEQVTFSTQEIEQLVIGIQEETTQMMSMMEESTTQVVTGTNLVKNTKDNLQKLAQISNQIDTLLESITASTVQQKLISQKVNNQMQEVAVVTKQTADESNTVSQSLQELVTVATDMQKSASDFQVN